MTDLLTRLILPIDMAERRFVVCEHSGDTFSEDEDYDGLALTLELKNPEEARAVLGALFGDQDTPHEHLADTEARHAHRDLLAEKDAEIERLTALLEAEKKRSHNMHRRAQKAEGAAESALFWLNMGIKVRRLAVEHGVPERLGRVPRYEVDKARDSLARIKEPSIA